MRHAGGQHRRSAHAPCGFGHWLRQQAHKELKGLQEICNFTARLPSSRKGVSCTRGGTRVHTVYTSVQLTAAAIERHGSNGAPPPRSAALLSAAAAASRFAKPHISTPPSGRRGSNGAPPPRFAAARSAAAATYSLSGGSESSGASLRMIFEAQRRSACDWGCCVFVLCVVCVIGRWQAAGSRLAPPCG